MNKNIITLAILLCSTASSYAMTAIDLDKHDFTCNQVRLTQKSSEAEITDNCYNVKTYHRQNGIEGRNPSRLQGGGADITQITTPAQEIVLDKIRFYDDKHRELICIFEHNMIKKCKAEIKKEQTSEKPE
ncbi:MAG: hypothetical protein EKK54_08525 [Neisseriaceae bacterium]|nr:MAG: hypothetical protein EKK54_08525 [Neisseriaceae bacterium]